MHASTKAKNCRIESIHSGVVSLNPLNVTYEGADNGVIHKITRETGTFHAVGKSGRDGEENCLAAMLSGLPQELKEAQQALRADRATKDMASEIVSDVTGRIVPGPKNLMVLNPVSHTHFADRADLAVRICKALGNLKLIITPAFKPIKRGNTIEYIPGFTFESRHSTSTDINDAITYGFRKGLAGMTGSSMSLESEGVYRVSGRPTPDRATAMKQSQEMVKQAIKDLHLRQEDVTRGRGVG